MVLVVGVCKLGLVEKGKELIKRHMSFYIEDYFRHYLFPYISYIEVPLDESEGLWQSDATLLASVHLVELLEPSLHFLFNVSFLCLGAQHIKLLLIDKNDA